MPIEHLTTNETYTVNINIFSYKNPWGKQLLKNSNSYKQTELIPWNCSMYLNYSEI